jgi:hypothetical protein
MFTPEWNHRPQSHNQPLSAQTLARSHTRHSWAAQPYECGGTPTGVRPEPGSGWRCACQRGSWNSGPGRWTARAVTGGGRIPSGRDSADAAGRAGILWDKGFGARRSSMTQCSSAPVPWTISGTTGVAPSLNRAMASCRRKTSSHLGAGRPGAGRPGTALPPVAGLGCDDRRARGGR